MEKADSQPQPRHSPESVDAERGSRKKGEGHSGERKPGHEKKKKTQEVHQF